MRVKGDANARLHFADYSKKRPVQVGIPPSLMFMALELVKGALDRVTGEVKYPPPFSGF